jgi:hypothetical protein
VRFHHPDRPGRSVRLAYCLNLHSAEDLAGCLEGIERITIPLRDQLGGKVEGGFGIGMYLPAAVAFELNSPGGEQALAGLRSFLEAESLDPFTFNAFPYGDFHRSGLKSRVFDPFWCEAERLEYSLAVAAVAAELWRGGSGHLSISTHPGRYGPWAAGEFARAAANFGSLVVELAQIEAGGGPRIVLGLEPEPRACAGDTAAVAALHEELRGALRDRVEPALLDRHLGTCLDTCHSAVEFEEVGEVLELCAGAPLSKLQFSSAIELRDPRENKGGREALLALDEERFLHQTTGHSERGFLRTADLPELRSAVGEPGSSWFDCERWRTHFHVPVDLADLGLPGLSTTREHARAILTRLLRAPERWSGDELHVEIETYTWGILPAPARGSGDLVAGLRREYDEVLALLAREGWSRGGG